MKEYLDNFHSKGNPPTKKERNRLVSGGTLEELLDAVLPDRWAPVDTRPLVLSQETSENVVFSVDLPGVFLTELSVSVCRGETSSTISITGTRHPIANIRTPFTKFSETVRVSFRVFEEDIRAVLVNGVLTLTINKVIRPVSKPSFIVPVSNS